MEKGNYIVIRWCNEQVSNFKGGDEFGWEIVVLHEIGKCLAEMLITGKRLFNVFGVGVCIVETLTEVAVGIFIFGGAMGVGVSFIECVEIMSARVVSGEEGHDSGGRKDTIFVLKL